MKEYAGKKAIEILCDFVKTELSKKANSAHSHSTATQSAAGFLSAADKKKLDGIGTGANKYTHPTYTEHATGLYKIESDSTGHIKSAAAVTKADITGLGIPAQDTKYTHPTSSGNKHIPAGGESGQILRWAADGTAAWGADNNTVYTPASAAPKANGTAAVGTSVKYAREDHVHPVQTSVSGNSGTTTKLATARTFQTNLGSTSAVSFDGSANVTPGVTGVLPVANGGTGNSTGNAPTATKATQDSSGQQINSTYIKGLSVSGKVITYTKGDGTTGTITTQDTNTTYGTMAGASASADGKSGLVPVPAKGAANRYLRSDGTWQVPPDTNTTYAAASQSAAGLMSAADKKKLDTYSATAPTALPANGGTSDVAKKLQTARQINGTNFDGSANITTAKWGTARAVALAGDSVGSANVDGSANVTISTKRRGCMVGQTGNTTANPWFKFASLQVPSVNYDGHIMFHVYHNYSDTSTKMGILKCHIRTQTNNYWQQSELVWEYASSSIPVADFVLVHTADNVAPCIVELWCKCAIAYAGYQFDVIGEGHRFNRGAAWTLYDSPAGAAAVTSGRVTQNSTLMTLQNPVVGNASTATKATQDSAGQQINTTYIKALSVNGRTITYTRGDNTTGTITTQDTNTTYAAATQSANGLMSAADKKKLDGIAESANKYVHPSYTAKAAGLYKVTVDASGHVSAATAVTKADITALGIPAQDTNTVYTHPTTAGNKHIPAGGSAGQFLKWSADGTAVWAADNNTTYSNMGGATASAAGKAGLVPAPAAGKQTSFLRGDGTWVVPTNTTYTNMTAATASAAGKAGLVPAPAAGAQAKYLRGDGTWQTPPDTNTVYTHPAYTARTGQPTANATPGFGSTFNISQITSDATGHVTNAVNRTVKIPNTAASSSAAGLMSAADKAKLDLITKPATTGYVIQKDSTGYYIEV